MRKKRRKIKKYLIENHSWDKITQETFEVYRSVVK